jgi:mannose-6-phosphate isomerase
MSGRYDSRPSDNPVFRIPIGASRLDLTRPLRPAPVLSERPWAGTRLGDGIGEIWVAGPGSEVTGPNGVLTLDALAETAREALVGTAGMAALGPRFPLLAKLIDAAEWLSLQVHPEDALARRLFGEAAVGKDEAWVVLEVDPGTHLVTGPSRELDADEVIAEVAAGAMGLDHCDLRDALPGETLNVPAGTIHAIGPGAFIYELEQPSDLTFRISDWGRPATPGRHLHLDEARQAVVPSQHAEHLGSDWALDGGALNDRHLRLELATLASRRSPAGRSPEVVTAVRGGLTLSGDGWTERVEPLGTVVMAAAVAAYELTPDDGAVAIIGSLPLLSSSTRAGF